MEFFILGLQALKSMHARMQDSVEGSQVLHDRPRMSTTTIDFDYLVCNVPLFSSQSRVLFSKFLCQVVKVETNQDTYRITYLDEKEECTLSSLTGLSG